MAVRSTTERPTARGQSVEDDLRDLQIDGYRIESSVRVALLPVELAETEHGARDGEQPSS